MIEVELEVVGVEETMELLRDTEEAAQDLSKAFHVIDHKLSDFFHRQFWESGIPGGKPWAPLSEGAKRFRVSKWGTNKGGTERPLWDTGRLKDSLTVPAGEGFRVIEKSLYQRGTTVPYAVTHQLGLRGNESREMIPDPIPQAMLIEWTRIVVDHLEN